MKTAFITGGASGLGESISREFAKNNYNLIICYHSNKDKTLKLKKELESNEIKIECIHCDLTNEESIKKAVNRAREAFNHIDVLVNNAALCMDSLYEDKTKDNFMKTLEVNLVGTFLISRLIGNMMYERNQGSIINVSSTNGINKNFPMSLDYDASKAGLNNLTHNLALQYAPFVRVNAVAPGWVKTENEMNELPEDYIASEEEKIFLRRFAEPKEIAKIILFLASEDSSYINNQIIQADGGTY